MKIFGINNFTFKEIEDNCLNPDNIGLGLILKLDKLRNTLRLPINILDLNRLKHAENSYHYKLPCSAVDFRVIGDIEENKLLQAMLDVGFKGIGFYDTGFVHGDIRPKFALWRRIKGIYYPMF